MSDFNPVAPSRAQPDPYKRVNYTLGLVLGVDEFDQEQAYFLERDRQHNRELHGYGTVCGLALSHDGAQVIVSPGLAIDPLGRVIRVNKEQCGDINDWLSVPSNASQLGSAGQPTQLYVVLCYKECQTDKVPIPGVPCRSEEESLDYSRVTETFTLEFQAVPPETVEEEVVRSFGALLDRIQITASGSGPFLTADELAAMVRGLLNTESPPSSPLPSPLPSPLASPLDGVLWLRPEDAAAVLGHAFKVWVTEVRPQIAACGLKGITDVACVLLGQVSFGFEQTTSGPMVSGGQVEIVDDDRPILLHTRLLQEWLFRTLSGTEALTGGEMTSPISQPLLGGPQSFLSEPFPGGPALPAGIPRPLADAAPAGPTNFVERPENASYAVLAAGICKASGARAVRAKAGLKTQTLSEGLMQVTFDNYTPPDGAFQYILKATPVIDAATRQKFKLAGPVVIVDSFTPEGIQLFITDQGVPLKVTALNAIQLMLEINLYRPA